MRQTGLAASVAATSNVTAAILSRATRSQAMLRGSLGSQKRAPFAVKACVRWLVTAGAGRHGRRLRGAWGVAGLILWKRADLLCWFNAGAAPLPSAQGGMKGTGVALAQKGESRLHVRCPSTRSSWAYSRADMGVCGRVPRLLPRGATVWHVARDCARMLSTVFYLEGHCGHKRLNSSRVFWILTSLLICGREPLDPHTCVIAD